MKYLLIPLMCLLATFKIVLQSKFSKGRKNDIADKFFYNGVVFLTSALLFLPSLLKNGVSGGTLFFGIIMGALSVMFQVFYICAFSKGKMALTVIINNFSMILPILVSFLLFKDAFGTFKVLGTVLALVSFVLSAKKDKKVGKAGFQWLLFTLLVFLSNGLISINQKVYSETTANFQVFEFVSVAYITATLLSVIILAILSLKNRSVQYIKQPKVIASGFIVGILLGVFQCINTYAASVIDGTILYSVYNCGVSLMSVVTGRILFKEKLSKVQYAGVIVGTLAIVFLCV